MSIKNPNPVTTWKKGMECWYEEAWAGVPHQAVITDIKTHKDGFEYAELKDINDFYGNTGRPLDELFTTQQGVLDAMVQHSTTRVSQMESAIKTVEDLVQFGYTHNISRSEEYTDWDARQAYYNKAKELLGLDLED